jgi:hypothetical protein
MRGTTGIVNTIFSRLCRIPFIIAQNKKHTCFEEGQCLSPQTAHAQCDSAVITFSGVIVFGGNSSGGGETT